MSDPSNLAAFLDLAWSCLTDKTSPARQLSFATVAPDGAPQVRTVVLRAADRAGAVVEVHTDAASAKIAALDADPRAQLMIWDEGLRLQIRLSARVEVLGGAAVAGHWERVPEASRASYGKSPAPGLPIAGPHDYTLLHDRAAFRVLRCHVQAMDLVELQEIHRRAVYLAGDGWSGQWLVP
ncbi:pyridoxamine 5'-phosphate oxidase family protein [Aestuariivita boseongensis]|uniref:pyridoxamine 5'-phosphate oxidase family protein n=1 Tax=Aestuariivita boseongensis TaxID=1470562 RepID=UPI0006807ECC|nr:pyridoxamine 5'-phosphate oxidase family protein [Aestuariivita boseongensis]